MIHGWLRPEALWGLAFMAVPIVLHLLNRTRGRKVMVGDARFLEAGKSRRLRRIALYQWVLLCLRLALITLATVVAAGPLAWPSKPEPLHIYISPAVVEFGAQAAWQERIRQARLDNVPVFWLAPGYPAWKQAEPAPVEGLRTSNGAWSLLAQRDGQVQTETDWEVFVLDRVDQLGYVRPAVQRQITWHAVPDVSPRPASPLPQLKGNVLIVTGADRDRDAAFLKAGLEALNSAENIQLDIRIQAAKDLVVSVTPHWVFLLGTDLPEPFPSGLNPQTLNWVWRDGRGGDFEPAVRPTFQIPHASIWPKALKLSPSKLPGTPIWTTELGQPVLTLEPQTPFSSLHFASRLHPSFSDLVVRDDFPAILFMLLQDPAGPDPMLLYGDVPVGEEVAKPHQAQGRSKPLLGQTPWWPALVLTVLWLLERWLSERRPADEDMA